VTVAISAHQKCPTKAQAQVRHGTAILELETRTAGSIASKCSLDQARDTLVLDARTSDADFALLRSCFRDLLFGLWPFHEA
jgi:hypothetical protein